MNELPRYDIMELIDLVQWSDGSIEIRPANHAPRPIINRFTNSVNNNSVNSVIEEV